MATAEELKGESSKSFEFIFRNGDGHRHRGTSGTPFLFDAGKRQNYFEIFLSRKIRAKTRTSCPQPADFSFFLLQIKFADGNFFRCRANQPLRVFQMLLSYTAVEFMQRFRFSSEQGALISALGSATGGGPVPTIQLVWESGAEGIAPSICGTLIREHQKFPGFPSPSGDEKYRSATVFHHSIGNFHYLTGMEDVWLGGAMLFLVAGV